MMRGGTAGFDIVQESFEYRIEITWRFPERGVPEASRALTAARPQIGVGDGIEIVEIDDTIRAAVDYGEWDRTAFHDQSLIRAFSGTRSFEEAFAKPAICAGHGIVEVCFGRFAENCLHETVNLCLGQLLLSGDACMR